MIEMKNFFIKSQRGRAYFCALALLNNEKKSIAFWTTKKKGDRMKINFLNSISSKAGADFPAPTRQPLPSQKSNNEWKKKDNDDETQTYKRASAGARIFARWLFWIMKSSASQFWTVNEKGDRMKTNFFEIVSVLRLARRANFSRQPFKRKSKCL